MITRATILAGDPASPVVLHVPQCHAMPTGELTPRMLLDGSLDSIADRIAQRARKQAKLRPHVVLNRLPVYLADHLDVAGHSERRAGHAQLCTRHAAAISTPPIDPYRAFVEGIVDERIAGTGEATVIEIRSTAAAESSATPSITLGVDPLLTPPSLIAAAADAFTDFNPEQRPESAASWHHAAHLDDAAVHTLTVELHPTATAASPAEAVLLGDALARIASAVAGDHRC